MRFKHPLLTDYSFEHLAITPDNRAMDLDNWTALQFGQYLLDAETQQLSRDCIGLAGYRLMHLGVAGARCALKSFDQLHQFYIRPSEQSGLNFDGNSAVAAYEDLPLPSDVVDVAIVQHALEYSASPQAVLAEAARVLVPGGHMVLCVLNPLGPMGLLKWPMRLFTQRAEFDFFSLRKGRVFDWLSLLNCEVINIQNGAYNLPIDQPSWLQHRSLLEQMCQKIGFPLGNFYMIHAVKRVTGGIRNSSSSWRPLAAGTYGAKRANINQSTTGSVKLK